MLFCFNLAITIWSPSPFGWAMVGFTAGGVFIMALDNPLLNIMDEHIDFLMKAYERGMLNRNQKGGLK